MSWVRYDDGFGKHRKTLEVKARCREALALHLLCNTWSASTDCPGHVPLAAVIEEGGGKAKGLKWARALVAAGMWHAAGHDCGRCPAIEGDGYVIHDFEVGRVWPGQGRPSRPEIPASVRSMVLERDEHACIECGATSDLTLDHIHPWSLGGSDEAVNLRVLCRSCNSRKGARV
jgi:5-methylcytosine-specific restriction endonuclease McrA